MSDEQRVAEYIEDSLLGRNLHNQTWNGDDLIKTVNLHKPWFVVEFYMSHRFENFHAHVSTESRDCDGGHGYQFTTKATDIRTGIKDEWDFESYMLRSSIETHNEGTTVNFHGNGNFDTNAPNEEGYRSVSVQFCYARSCVEGAGGDGTLSNTLRLQWPTCPPVPCGPGMSWLVSVCVTRILSLVGSWGRSWNMAADALNSDNPLDTLNGPKVKAFAANLLGDTTQVTVDVWAIRAACQDRSDEVNLSHKGVYAKIEKAYQDATDARAEIAVLGITSNCPI